MNSSSDEEDDEDEGNKVSVIPAPKGDVEQDDDNDAVKSQIPALNEMLVANVSRVTSSDCSGNRRLISADPHQIVIKKLPIHPDISGNKRLAE